MESIYKFTLSLSCLIFFFIGAPLGAIIRKGGLGVPVIISVIVFIIYYIFDNSGFRMARSNVWTVWFGRLVSTMVLAPLAIFFTYKANKDSTVFNMDTYRNLFFALLGIRTKRHFTKKEVVINDPQYARDAELLRQMTLDIEDYSDHHHLLKAPNPIKVFFRPGDDHRIQEISEQLEEVIEDLQNTKDKVLISLLNRYPVMVTHAHTRPFRRKWLNIVTGLCLPVGVFFYFRMWRSRLRLLKDLRVVKQTNHEVVERIGQVAL